MRSFCDVRSQVESVHLDKADDTLLFATPTSTLLKLLGDLLTTKLLSTRETPVDNPIVHNWYGRTFWNKAECFWKSEDESPKCHNGDPECIAILPTLFPCTASKNESWLYLTCTGQKFSSSWTFPDPDKLSVLGTFEGHRLAKASRTVPSPSSPASTYASASPQLSNDIWFPMALMKLFDTWSPPRRGVNLFWYCRTGYSSSISLQYRAWSSVRFVYSWPKWEDIPVHLFTAVFKYQNPEHWREWFGNNKLLSALIYLMIMTNWKQSTKILTPYPDDVNRKQGL